MPCRRFAHRAAGLLGRMLAAAAIAGAALPAGAGPFVPAGDAALRADIELLADYGILEGPVTTWPLAWGPILDRLEDVALADVPPPVARARERVLATGLRHARTGEVSFSAALTAAEKPSRIRSFAAAGPRESAEAWAGLDWIGDRVAVQLHGGIVDSPENGKEARLDGSAIAAAIGNFTLAASTLDRWWGPGWDGSLVLSNNARPIPALVLDRNFTDAFQTRWLSWIGPWDLSVILGRMESERVVPHARFFGMRFNFRPLPGLEIGVSRVAQWCGEGRPCDLDTFIDLLAGRDNRGDEGIGIDNEPGNQLAGFDFRGSLARFGWPVALYGQVIGEDEAGGFPSRYLAQLGLEGGGIRSERWSYRWFGEIADTSCGFYRSDAAFNCAYGHGIYRTGYRYRGRALGHGADGDARLVSAGLMLIDDGGTRWNFLARYGELNRGGVPEPEHTITPVPEDIASFDVAWSREVRFGVIALGAGAERTDDTDFRGYLEWRTR